jgi:hypothetical protein
VHAVPQMKNKQLIGNRWILEKLQMREDAHRVDAGAWMGEKVGGIVFLPSAYWSDIFLGVSQPLAGRKTHVFRTSCWFYLVV